MLRVIGKGQKEREVLVPIKVVGELAKYVKSRGLDPDPEDIGNQGAHLLGKDGDAAQRAPRLSHGGAARSEAAHRGDRLLRPDQGVLQRLRRRAARAGRCTGRQIASLDAALACEPRNRQGHAHRDRAAEPRPRVARDDDGRRDEREQATDEGCRNVLEDVALTWVPTRLPADSGEFHHSFIPNRSPPPSIGPGESKVASRPSRTTINAGRTIPE